jgi:plasmid stability protein
MRTITVREIPDEVHSALKQRALRSGRSIAAEIHSILFSAVIETGDLKLGSALAAIGRQIAAAGNEFNPVRDQTPAGSTVDFGDE